jgi:hypothetical protein
VVSLYTRLLGTSGVKIPNHQFASFLGEIESGHRSEADAATAFNLDAGEQTELATLVAKIKPVRESYCLGGRVVLTNVGSSVDTTADSQSLPFVYIQKNGITRLDLEVRNRIAAGQTGDVSYVLRNDTDGDNALSTANATGGSLTDAATAGDHTLNAHRVFAAPLTPGIVKLRLQVSSTTAADDPVFLGAALLVTRNDSLSADDLHRILMLADDGSAYTTEAALKARLGVS